jgi:hypothetical protein
VKGCAGKIVVFLWEMPPLDVALQTIRKKTQLTERRWSGEEGEWGDT